MNRDLAVVILAAGLGKRMKSRLPKVLHRAGGKTLLEWVVSTASRLVSADHIQVVIGPRAEAVGEVLKPWGAGVVVQEQQLGTGHAVLAARKALEAAPQVLILYGDCPLVSQQTLERLVERQVAAAAAAAVVTTRLADPAAYGRIVRDSGGRVQAIVEFNDATPQQRTITEINSGIYCFESAALSNALGRLRPENRSGEYYLTDVIGDLAAQGRGVEAVEAADPAEVLGINTRVELAEVDALLRARKARELMLEGVTIERPETVTIDAQVSVGQDTVLEPFVQLLGPTSIGAGCRIRSCSVVSDSALADEVTVEPFSWIHGSQIGARARIGPYARLRAGNVVGPDARVGNFVELKQTRLGPGSKANHLAYLGDAVIGADVNVGAGTITCNYDGQAKHPTTIEDGAFIGSNSTLVAPVTIGRDAYLAAGSAITEDVPPESLAIARSRQTNKAEWVKKRSRKEAKTAK